MEEMTVPNIVDILDAPDRAEVLARAGRDLRAGHLVVFPTETVYGLGANALHKEAVASIFRVKKRPANNPIIVHISDSEAIGRVAANWPLSAAKLAERFWPGPLTIVVEKSSEICDTLTAGLPTVGIRMPNHPIALALIESAGVPIAAPSANRYMSLSPTTAQAAATSLGIDPALTVFLDAGPTQVGIESTVISLAGSRATILRPGMLGRAEIESVIGPINIDDGSAKPDTAHRSPGRSLRHYAPKALLHIGSLPNDEKRATTGLLSLSDQPASKVDHVVDMPSDPKAYGQKLYGVLFDLDQLGCEVILVDPPPRGQAWTAIWDRLMRAATPTTFAKFDSKNTNG
jgi:L-threonylcarbamoyladenylate synthase